MKKLIYLILISSIYLSFSATFAGSEENTDNGDCGYVTETKGKFGTILESWSGQNEIVYPKESIRRALLNLKAACCNLNKIGKESESCKNDKTDGFLLENYPQSIFLYDHLMDIGLRRLDAIESLLYEGIIPDQKGKERRDFINKKGSQEEGTTPTDIMPEFKKQWTQNINYQLEYRQDGNYKNQYENDWIKKTKDYNDWPLINRYGNMCEISAYIYGYLGAELQNYTKTYGYSKCKILKEDIISRNITFVKAIVLKKANKLLYDNLDSYITNYISKTRLQKLKETILSIVQAFNAINKKVVQLVKECS